MKIVNDEYKCDCPVMNIPFGVIFKEGGEIYMMTNQRDCEVCTIVNMTTGEISTINGTKLVIPLPEAKLMI